MSRRRGMRDGVSLAAEGRCLVGDRSLCGRSTRDQAYICEECLDKLAAALRALLPARDTRRTLVLQFGTVCPFPARLLGERVDGLWDTLLSVLAGEQGTDYRKVGGSSGGGKATGLELNERAVGVARDVERSLLDLVVACRAARVTSPSPVLDPRRGRLRARTDMVPDMARWLLWRIDGMAFHPEFPELLHQAVRAIESAEWVVDRPPTRQQLGECPECGDRLSATPGATFARCENKACRHETEAQPLRDAVLAALGSSLVTAAQFADLAVNLTEYADWKRARESIRKRVNQWSSRGRIHPVPGPDDDGDLFRFNELYALEVDHLDRARAHATREGA